MLSIIEPRIWRTLMQLRRRIGVTLLKWAISFAACMFRVANHSFFEPIGRQIRYLGTIEYGEQRLALERTGKTIWKNM